LGIFSQAERVSANGGYRVWSSPPGLICALAVTDALPPLIGSVILGEGRPPFTDCCPPAGCFLRAHYVLQQQLGSQ